MLLTPALLRKGSFNSPQKISGLVQKGGKGVSKSFLGPFFTTLVLVA